MPRKLKLKGQQRWRKLWQRSWMLQGTPNSSRTPWIGRTYSLSLLVPTWLLWWVSVFSHFYRGWPVSRHDIIGISNGSVDAADHMTIGLVMGWLTVKFMWPPVGWQWGWWANGSANRASSSNYQSANSGIGELMGWPTEQVQVTTSRPTVG